jgi:transposase
MRFVPIRSIGTTKFVNFWCLNAPSCSTRCAAIWRRLALLPPRDRLEPTHWLQRSWRVISSIPLCVREALAPIVRQLQSLSDEIAVSDRAILELAKVDRTARRLMSIPGIGPITASAIAASAQDVGAFSSPREFARPTDPRRSAATAEI